MSKGKVELRVVPTCRVKYYAKDEMYSEWFTCFSCNINDVARRFKFCPHCGTKIDWDRSEREGLLKSNGR